MAEEALIQKKIMEWLKKEGYWHRRIPVGPVLHAGVRKKSPLKGMPDLMVSKGQGQMVFVEVKDPEGKLSLDQEHIHFELEMEGFEVYVVHSLEELIPFFKKVG